MQVPITDATNFAMLLNQHSPAREKGVHFSVTLKRSKRDRKRGGGGAGSQAAAGGEGEAEVVGGHLPKLSGPPGEGGPTNPVAKASAQAAREMLLRGGKSPPAVPAPAPQLTKQQQQQQKQQEQKQRAEQQRAEQQRAEQQRAGQQRAGQPVPAPAPPPAAPTPSPPSVWGQGAPPAQGSSPPGAPPPGASVPASAAPPPGSAPMARQGSMPLVARASVPPGGRRCVFCAHCLARGESTPAFHWCPDDPIVPGFQGPSPYGAIGQPITRGGEGAPPSQLGAQQPPAREVGVGGH